MVAETFSLSVLAGSINSLFNPRQIRPSSPQAKVPWTFPFPAIEPAPAAGADRIRLQVHEARAPYEKNRAGSHAISIPSMRRTPPTPIIRPPRRATLFHPSYCRPKKLVAGE